MYDYQKGAVSMKKERQPYQDVSYEYKDNGNFGLSGFLAAAGIYLIKLISAILLFIIKGIRLIFTEIKELFILFAKALRWIFRDLSAPMKERIALNRELQKNMRTAKKQSREAYKTASRKFWISYIFGKSGLFFTMLNYLLPIASIFFLVAVIRYGSKLEYGISVVYRNREIGVISAESIYDAAARDVDQRLSYTSDDGERTELAAQLSLKIISGEDKMLNSSQLANELLSASEGEFAEACGVYVNNKFVGAVRDKTAIQDALNQKLLNYPIDGIVKEVSYKDSIDYINGMYLTSSIMKNSEMIKLLTSSTSKPAVYVAGDNDTPVTISKKYNMSLEELEKLNPNIEKNFRVGKLVNVTETESYLPIQYVREMELVSMLDYETIEVETSTLNLGARQLLVKGSLGEKSSNVEITYVDGKEYSRKTVSAKITKVPVVEQIGIGTYKAHPDSPDTKIYGTGQFAWPVNGGWVSDVFISDRNHKGFDIAADTGTEIYAAGNGVVVSAGWNPGGYGYFVMIDHLDGYQTVYAHMSQVYAKEGDPVMRGSLIGAVGSTGDSTGPHCHFEVRYMGVCYDPAQFMYTADWEKDVNIESLMADTALQ